MTPWEELQNECSRCRACALSATRKNVVFGVGNTEAEVLFIGEGPGANEDEQGLPFVGRSGQLLDKYLAAIHLKRDHPECSKMMKAEDKVKGILPMVGKRLGQTVVTKLGGKKD